MTTLSPTVSSPSTSSKAPPLQQTSSPTEKAHAIDILPTPVAQAYSHIHPTILLGLYSLRFSSLVSDPVSTLWSDLPLYTIMQAVYVVTCLPQAGSLQQHQHGYGHGETGSGDAGDVKKTPSGKRKRHASSHKSDTLSQKFTASFISLTLTFLLGTPVLSILLILFGAPFTTHTAHTVLCAAHMALLTVMPLVYVHGVDSLVWKQVWAFARPADALWGGALGACVGAWLGAVPIPLDWDRPWQAYPITILTGAYLGFAIGQLLGRSPLLYGKRIEFD
ncbi:GPI-anchor biosynthesis protein (Pig-F), putative [Talaromyces stipitatus ATCC 10500]|uniref:GPI-anchor biosynthesis protein (Pig-F), putative n=1 Tax=Talaromyces stipitatus (strain ATCC 10500 / CBS 375.48 / QM 6759 / NRRL 1006) TaxID=441959 RepID=B8M5G4_TALSN|nr:GPI-anchor biosynthesis protein (Pig-F), putative [Talaromyces stipitatus ATCC 10500]EED19770.1 GPI-anchor biosynthesis protein (Pig-F), putative [Talaromyces stipitatus ATCC 10500]